MDPDTKRLVIFACGLGAVLVTLIGASALMGRRSAEVPVITADARPIREKPANPGGMKIDGAENDVFSGGTDTSNPRLAPAPESPNTKALRAADDTPPPAIGAPAPLSSSAPATTPPATSASLPAPPATPAQVTKPAVVANTAPKSPSATIQPATTTPVKPTPAKPAAAEETHPAPAGHSPMVQLAALPSEDAAHTEWAQLTRKMPDLLNGRQPNYSRVERDGHAFWRVRTAGFTDVNQARTFCDHVRAKGAGCSVADF
jgi:hypothetical protein